MSYKSVVSSTADDADLEQLIIHLSNTKENWPSVHYVSGCQHQCTLLELYLSPSRVFYSGIWKIILSKSKGNPWCQMKSHSRHSHAFLQQDHNKTPWGARCAGKGRDCYHRAVLEKNKLIALFCWKFYFCYFTVGREEDPASPTQRSTFLSFLRWHKL